MNHQLWLSGGRPSLDPRVGEGTNPEESILIASTCKVFFSDGNLGTRRKASSYFSCQYHSIQFYFTLAFTMFVDDYYCEIILYIKVTYLKIPYCVV